MFCSNCGKKIPADSKFCEKCGQVIESDDEMDKTVTIDEEKIHEEISSNKEEDKVAEEPKEEITETIEETNENDSDDDDTIEYNGKKVLSSHTMLLNNLDDAVADLRPDDFDELMPKSSNLRIIIISILLILIVIGICIYFLIITPKNVKEDKPVVNYQQIINDYAKSIESVSAQYLLDHDVINDFSEIRSLVKYKDHKVSCENVYVNIDGTVYLSGCTVDGKKVEEGYGKRKNILTKTDGSACNIKYDSAKGELNFYVEEELISVYSCKNSECGEYLKDDFKYNSCLDSIALIKDGDKIILYSYESGQELFDSFSVVAPVKSNDKVLGLIVKDYLTEKYGYVSVKGVSILKMEYDALGIIKDGKLLDVSIDIKNSKIVASKNNKYGVIGLNNNKQYIDYSYSDIYFAPNNNYVVKYGDMYYLVDSTDEKVLQKPYKMIFPFDDVIVVNEDNKLKFIDYKEKSIITDEIDTYLDYNIRGKNIGYDVYKKDNKIMIDVYKNTEDIISYEYSINSKKLTKLTEEKETTNNIISNNNSNSNIEGE